MAERAGRLFRDIDLAGLKPLDQLVGRKIDDLDLGDFEHAIGHRLAHPDAGEGGDDVVEAFDVLDVDRREDVDSGGEQLLDVLIAFGMAAARRIGVRKFVDQHELGPALEQRIEIHLGEGTAFISNLTARHDVQPARHRLGLGAAMRLDHADYYNNPGPCTGRTLAQHLIGFADTGRGAQKHLQTTTAFLRGGAQKGFWIGSLVFGTHGADVARNVSNCRLSRNTLTCASPRNGRSGRSTDFSTRSRTRASASPRTFATRFTWNKAASGLMSGSSPEAEAVTRSAGTALPGAEADHGGDVALQRGSLSAWAAGPRLEPDEASPS